MSTASKSEIATTFINAKLAILERICLLEMGYPQPVTPFEIDKTTAYGILTKQLIPKQSKAIDMRFYWLRDRSNQGLFRMYWKKGDTNKADYFTKHHLATYYRKIWNLYVVS